LQAFLRSRSFLLISTVLILSFACNDFSISLLVTLASACQQARANQLIFVFNSLSKKEILLFDLFIFLLQFTHGRKIQGVEALKVLAYPLSNNSACLNFLFQVVLSIYGEYK